MKVAVFSSKSYDRDYLTRCNTGDAHEFVFISARLNHVTVELAKDCQAICVFVNDPVDAEIQGRLVEFGIQFVATRSAGFNHIDLEAASRLGVTIVRVPAYSPYAVAEHTVGLMLCLNRKYHRSYHRVRDNNFALEGLLGFDMRGKTVGIVGTGKIGRVVAEIMHGFGCHLLAFDPNPHLECLELGAQYTDLKTLLAQSDIVTLHCPLTPETHHLIDRESIGEMKDGAMLINTSRGGLVDTGAVISQLKSKKLGSLGIDVYEEEGDLFFEDLSDQVIQDDQFSRLLTFPNVLITGHQAFFTNEAMMAIAETTVQNLSDLEAKGKCDNAVRFDAP